MHTAGPRTRSWLRAVAAAIGLSALLVGATVAWLARSDDGSAWLLARVPGLTVTASQGRLLGGAFAAERVEYRFGQRSLTVQGLAWNDAAWYWRPHPGAWFGLALTSPRAARIDLAGPSSGDPIKPPANLRLPLALQLQDARIGALHVDGQTPFANIAGSVTLGAHEGGEHRLAQLSFDWDRAHVQAQGSIDSDAPFAVELQADARHIEGTATPWQASASAQGPLRQLELKARLGSDKVRGAALQAQATLLPFAAWPVAQLSATMQDLDLATLASAWPSTQLSGRADIDSRGLDAPVSARIALANTKPDRWDRGGLPIASLDLELSGRANDRAHLSVQRFAMQLSEGAGRIEGSGEWRDTAAQLSLRLQSVRPALLDARAAAMTLSGPATLELSGLPSPDGATALAPSQKLQARVALEGRLDARSALPVQLSAQADAERSAVAWRLDLRQLQLRSGNARVQGHLSAQGKGTEWQLQSGGELAGWDPALWFPSAGNAAWRKGPHRLAGEWRADVQGGAAMTAAKTPDARLLALRGQAELSLHDSLLAGVPLQASVKLDGRSPGWGVNAALDSGGNHATLQGHLAPRTDDDRWQWVLDAPALGALQPFVDLMPEAGRRALGGPTGAQIAGQLNAKLQTQGRWPALGVEGELDATALHAAGLRAARLHLTARIGSRANAPLAATLDAQQLQVQGIRADKLQLQIEGSLAEHRIALELQSPVRPPAWADAPLGSPPAGTRIAVRGSGQWLPGDAGQGLLPGRWRGTALEILARDAAASNRAAWLLANDVRMQLQLDAGGTLQEASAEPGRAQFLGASLRWSQAQWKAASAGASAEALVDAQLDPLAVAPWIDKLRPRSGLGGNLMLAGHARVQIGRRVSADVVLERASGDLALTDEAGTQAFGLTDLRLAIAAEDGTWHFTQALAGTNLGVLAGAQSLRLPASARWPAPESPMQGVLEWQIADLGAWAPFTPPGWRLSGTLRTGAALGGTFGAPEVTGEMTGSKLAVRNLLQGVDVRDGELALSLRGSQARIERFVFKGGAGELRLTGGADLGSAPNARLQLEADRFTLLGRFDRRIVASGSAALQLTPQALGLDGKFRIDEGLVDFSRSDAPGLDSDVQVHGGRHAAPQAARAQADAADEAPTGTPRSTRVALQVDLGNDLKLRGHGIDTQLRGDLALTTPGGRMAVNGSVRTQAGTYAAYGQKLAIERGVLSFNGSAENPRLDILALRPNLDLRVGVLVAGTAQNPRVRLFSEPEMSDTDKLSWLVLGRAPDGLARADTALLQRAALALLAGDGQSVDSALLTNIGLDEFSVRQVEAGEVRDTVVTLGKQLSRRWYVGYERGVNSTAGTWQLIYRVAQRLTVRAQAGEDNALDAIWTWRWN